MLTEDLIEPAARRFGMLADPTRLRVLRTLLEDGELSVGAVAERTGTSRFNASAHLGKLALVGLVARRREGTTIYYRVADANLANVCDWMCESLRTRAGSAV